MLFTAKDITVTLSGDGGLFRAVDNISFELNAGEILDITGPSGSGKSTLLHALGMQVVSCTGTMLFQGVPSTQFAPQQWRRHIALVQQKPTLLAGTVKDNLLLPWSLKAYAQETPPTTNVLLQSLESARLGDITLDRSIDKLSVGQQARVAFLRTLLSAPRVLLLDEADAALDDASAEAIGEMTTAFVNQGNAAVRVRHRTDDGRATARITVIDGRIVDGQGGAHG